MREMAESSVDDAMAVGVADQARAFAGAVRGQAVEIPGAESSVRATEVGRAVIEATGSGRRVAVVSAR
jgi:predicted dehydrogenase